MATGDGDSDQPLSLRPNPVADRKPQNIAEFIARVNAEPGGFRALSEAKLREEIAQENAANGDAQDKDADMADGDEDDDDDQDAMSDPQEVRMEMLKNLEYANPSFSCTPDDLYKFIYANIYQRRSKHGPPYPRLPLPPHIEAEPYTSRSNSIAGPSRNGWHRHIGR